MKRAVINAVALAKAPSLTGIQRACREIILRLDALLENEPELKIEYAYRDGSPHNIIALDELKNIQPVPFPAYKKLNSRISLMDIPRYANKQNASVISPSLEFLRGGDKPSLGAVYDLRPLIYKNYDPLRFRLLFAFMMLLIKRGCGIIVTDSEFQKKDIQKHLKFPGKVSVVYLGWEHMKQVVPDMEIFKRFPRITPGKYFYTIGSRALHKNFQWIFEVAKRNQDQMFVVAGGRFSDAWEEMYGTIKLPNVVFTDYVTDEESKALMENCTAFLFPSKYEGFGLPPLEALSVGAKVICARATCLPEIFEDTVHYIDPDDYNVDLDTLLQEPVADCDKILKKCSWDRAAEQWLSLIKEVAK